MSSGPGPTFTVVTPQITGLSVSSGPPSQVLKVLGTNFGNGVDTGAGRLAGAGPHLQVRFNGVPGIVAGQFCCNLGGWTNTAITVTVPLSATTGPVEVRIEAFDINLATGALTAGFVSSGPGPTFTVVTPQITGIAPTSGPVGTRVTISGNSFGTNPFGGNQALFSGVVSPILLWSDTEVVAEVPTGVKAGATLITVSIQAFDINLATGALTAGFVFSNEFVGLEVGNTPPVANAGPDQSVRVGDLVTLDGSASFDVNGDSLTFSWSFAKNPDGTLKIPAGSTATLVNPTAPNPQFTVDKAGSYTVQLVVNDGAANSAADSVSISTVNSPPVANAGLDQGVTVGQTVQLDGSGSFDPDGDAFTFQWTLTQKPEGSTATLSDPKVAKPTFVADVFGSYKVSLVVHDGQVASAPDEVVISTVNVAPVANAGPDQAVPVNLTVQLDGTGSRDPEGQPLTFKWSFVSIPAGSFAKLSDPTAAKPTFFADVACNYLVQLIVNDGIVDSQPDTVSITAVSPGTVQDLLRQAINALSANCSDPTAFVNPNSCRALINKLEAVIKQVEQKALAAARNQITQDLQPKMDGCALRQQPDAPPSTEVRDWIIKCSVQDQVYPLLKDAEQALTVLMGG